MVFVEPMGGMNEGVFVGWVHTQLWDRMFQVGLTRKLLFPDELARLRRAKFYRFRRALSTKSRACGRRSPPTMR